MRVYRRKMVGASAIAVLLVFTFAAFGLHAQTTGEDAGVREEVIDTVKEAESSTKESGDGSGGRGPSRGEFEKKGPDHHMSGNDSPLVAIVVPLGFFSMIALIVIAPLVLRKRRRAIDAEVQKTAIEKGMQYIPELPASARPVRNDKRTGLIIAGVGLGILVPLLLAGHSNWAMVGLGPIMLGAVYFLAGVLLGKDKEEE